MTSTPDRAGSPAGEALSPGVLAELRTVGGEALVRDLMALFVERTPERLRSAEAARATGDLEALAGALHSLCSAAGTVGALRLAGMAGELERAARAGSGDALAAGLEALRAAADEALAEARRRRDAAS